MEVLNVALSSLPSLSLALRRRKRLSTLLSNMPKVLYTFYRRKQEKAFKTQTTEWKTMLRSWALLSCERRLHVRGYELACEKQPLPTTVQFSIVHAQNSSRDSQATGSSNLREFSRKLLANNSPRSFVLFSASSPLVLSILAAKCPRIVFFRKVFLCYHLQ